MDYLTKFLLIILLFSSQILMCQSNDPHVLDSVCGQLIEKVRSSQKNKVFLTTDKSVYKAGEALWFRVFLLHSVSQKFTAKDENVFVDVVNENDSVVHSPLLLNPSKGFVSGKINFSQSFHTGYYWIRAYTNCMAERDTSDMCVVPLYIVNAAALPNHISSLQETQTSSNLTLKFFPEGGTIITGINSVVGFQAANDNKEPLSISGYIKDNLDSVITSFSSDQYGLGVFQFFPKRYRKYSAHVIFNGYEKVFPLPPFNFHAAQLSLITKQDLPTIRVLLEDSIYSPRFKTYLIGVAKDSICFASTGTGMYELGIPVNKFPEGIASFYLFDSTMKLLSERSVYFRNNSLSIEANLNKNLFTKREKGLLTLSISNSYRQPVASSFSVTIADSSLFKTSSLSNLLTLTERQDAAENWLLSGVENLSDTQLNERMLFRTNTFSKITFQAADAHCLDQLNDTLLYIKGRIVNYRKHLSNKVVDLFSNSGDFVFYKDTTNAEGKFYFKTTYYPDSTRFYIQVSDENGNKEQCNVMLDTVLFPKPATPASLKKKLVVLPSVAKKLLQVDNSYPKIGKTMDTVVVKANKKRRLSFDETKRISSFSKIVTSDKLNKGGSGAIENALLGVQGLHTVNGYLVIGGFSGLAPGPNTEPIVIVDGTQAMLSAGIMGKASPVLSFLEQLDPRNIDFIEVLSGAEAAAYGMRGGNGVILINSKNHSADANSDPNDLISFVRRGYHSPSLFVMPDYYNNLVRKSSTTDVRSTLYWNGSILTDSTGKVEVPFFTSDIPGTYKVLIRGVTKQGDFIYKTIYFKVE